MLRKIILQINNSPEIIILIMMVMVIVMLIIPLPTYVVDLLIGLNLIISLLIFLSSFYVTKILDYSSFPSILLISTIFRLAISISTSRLVLADADAGDIIASFGNFVIGDNLVVGFVIFFIVSIVQFIVITKGSERVAEVAARFSLDAMPGKQMSIDADLRAGAIDEEEVKRRRSELEAESQLYGSLDGAMKFIKGDAIASIIIIFVNLIGGISVGVLQHGMDLSLSLSTFTILTIGDALVAQIPALLISISGGLIVTRVNSNDKKNLGAKILQDIFANKFILLITSILSVAIGLLPGFPFPVFIVLSLLLLVIFFKDKFKINNGSSGSSMALSEQSDYYKKNVVIDGEYIPEAVPLIISTWAGYEPYYEENNIASLLKRNFFVEYGIRLPDVIMNYDDNIQRGKLIVSINEIPVEVFDIFPEMCRVVMRGDELLKMVDSVHTVETSTGPTYWVHEEQSEPALRLGFYLRNAIEEFYCCVSTLLAHNTSEFFGIQETKILLDDLEKKYPDLLKECYRNCTVQRITEVFQRLLQERISIRNMRLILEAIVQWAPKEKDPILLVEHVRGALSRYISNRFSSNGCIRAIVMTHDMESMIRSGVRQTSGGTFINLTPSETEGVIKSLEFCINGNGINSRDIILLVPLDIRRFVKKIIENRYVEMDVLSYGDISNGIDIDVIGTLDAFIEEKDEI